MRGGIFEKNYDVSKSDFIQFVSQCNRGIYDRHAASLGKLPGTSARGQLTGILRQKVILTLTGYAWNIFLSNIQSSW
ncbi:MAG: hypothetical protein R2758_11005 [Bacteroidales bacterium]